MFDLSIIIVMALIMLCVQVSIFRALPKPLRLLCAKVPALGFAANLTGSMGVMMFTGAASGVGVANLMASVLFGVYLVIYKSRRKVVWQKPAKRFSIPRLVEQNPKRSLIF